MKNLFDYNLEGLQSLLLEMGEPKFRAKQIYANLVLGKSISEMTDIPNTLKERLLLDFADALNLEIGRAHV